MQDFESWYMRLVELAAKHSESVADVDAWREDYENGIDPEQAFYEEYPEHK